MLTKIKPFELDKSKSYVLCDCGEILISSNNDIDKQYLLSCGCQYTPTNRALTHFNNYNNPKLTKICIAGVTANKIKHSIYKMQCECGNKFTCRATNLKVGDTNSCGCYHNHVHSIQNGLLKQYKLEYSSYNAMINRCTNENHVSFKIYKDIPIDPQWLRENNGFVNFINDMGQIPNNLEKYSIERIDNSLGYFKENCKWLPIRLQARNMSTNVLSIELANMIRKDYLTTNLTMEQLSKKYDTCLSNISNVINYKTWVP